MNDDQTDELALNIYECIETKHPPITAALKGQNINIPAHAVIAVTDYLRREGHGSGSFAQVDAICRKSVALTASLVTA